MTTSELYKNLLFILNESEYSNAFTPDEFNTIISAEYQPYIRGKVQTLASEKKAKNTLSSVLFSMSFYDDLLEKNTIGLLAGYYDISSLTHDYMAFSSMYVPLYNGQPRRIELVSDEELTKRQSNLMSRNLAYYPVCTIRGSRLQVYPTDISSCVFFYVRKPDTPYLDYYVDANDNLNYLSAGQAYELQAGETYRDGTTSGSVSSLTKETGLTEDYSKELMELILERLGVRERDQIVVQESLTQQSK